MSTDHDNTGASHEGEVGVHYIPGLVAVGIDTGSDSGQEQLARLSELVRGRPADDGALRQLLDDDDSLRIAQITSLAGLISVDVDPAFAAAGISATGVPASPVHALGYQWHKSYSELPLGDDVEFDHEAMAPGNEGRIIAVVDSGISDQKVPGWLSDNVEADPIDVDADFDEASHGTFVASVIRQVAASHQIHMARAGRYRAQKLRGREEAHDAEPPPSTEAHVSAAILRLIDRLGGKRGAAVDALNISLGGPSDEIPTRAMVLLSAAIDRWRQAFPQATVFAAAGNSTDRRRVYPAAFPEVRAVSACDDAGETVVWSDRAGNLLLPVSPQQRKRRSWVNDIAPGIELVGLTGRGDETRKWSGSSLATAVAAAGYASGLPRTVRDGVSHWTV